MFRVAEVEKSYTPNAELSQFFVQLLNNYFEKHENPELKDSVNRYLTNKSGIAALNILSGQEIISAAAMFKVLRQINSEELNEDFLKNPMVLGNVDLEKVE